MSSTQEIEKAIAKLDAKTLKGSLKALNQTVNGDKEKVGEAYKKKVLEVGVRNFIKKLKAPDVKTACKTLNIKAPSDAEEARTALEEKVTDSGINDLITSADEGLLKKFCQTLGLESSEKDDMIKQIADEVMLTGMESFLSELTPALLKSHCTELELSTSGSKKDLVERLMVSIFELEPLETEDPKAKSGGSKKGSSEKKATGSKKRSASRSPSPAPSPKKKASGQKGKKGSGKKEAPKRQAWKAPPLETIKKGNYDTYVKLYDNFNLPDLVKYCKQNNIPCSGKKKVVINRILEYLKTGKVEETKKKSSKKRKATSSGKKAATKKQKTTSTTEKKENSSNA